MFRRLINSAKMNLRIELTYTLIMMFLVIIGFWSGYIFTINKQIQPYFDQDRMAKIADFFAIIIAIYLAVLTMLATSKSGIMPEMLRRNVDKDILAIIIVGMAESFIVTTTSVFMYKNNQVGYVILTILVLLAIIGFLNFMRIMTLFFYANTEELAKSITEESQQELRIENFLEKIERNTRK